MDRTSLIKSLRPEIPSLKISEDMTEIEKFQNEVIRPILKFQNDIILAYISARVNEKKSKFHHLIDLEKERYLDRVILKDNKVKQHLLGIVIGLFSVEELKVFIEDEAEYKRRINTMLRQRIVSQLSEIEESNKP